jgi:hypothetical protein
VCYSICLSTDSDLDLSARNSELIRFSKETIPEPYHSLLIYPNRWYVGSKSGCSCTFRHLYSVELGFSEPVAWYEESEADIAATLAFVKIVRNLLEWGCQVDCVDAWVGTQREEVTEISVNLDEITDQQFRFFENHHFIFESSMMHA